MTLVVIGPVTRDFVIIGDERSHKVGGATYFQSFVLEKFYEDYLAIVNCSDNELVGEFPNLDKVRVIENDNTHFFINEYPDKDNRDIRIQSSNFADIPILKSDLEGILEGFDVEGFIINPLNRNDFPFDTIEYLKGFDVPIFSSVQGFLRVPGVKVNENHAIKLDKFDGLGEVLRGFAAIFMDEGEANIVGQDFDVDEVIITNGSKGSRILCQNGEIKIDAVKCYNVVDTTGCGDTYMATYVSQRLMGNNQKQAGKFASSIASMKIRNFGPLKLK